MPLSAPSDRAYCDGERNERLRNSRYAPPSLRSSVRQLDCVLASCSLPAQYRLFYEVSGLMSRMDAWSVEAVYYRYDMRNRKQ